MAKVKKEDQPVVDNAEETSSVGFGGGITKETKVKNSVPFVPPILQDNQTYLFPIGGLKSVTYERALNKNKDYMDVIIFSFFEKGGERTHKERVMFPGDPNKMIGKKKDTPLIDVFNAKVGHIYAAFAEIPDLGIGVQHPVTGKAPQNAQEYCEALVHDFNCNGKDADGNPKPVFNGIYFWLKLIYNDAGFLQLPFGPNFIQRYDAKTACLLTVYSGDTLVAPKKVSKAKADVLGEHDDPDAAPEWPTDEVAD